MNFRKYERIFIIIIFFSALFSAPYILNSEFHILNFVFADSQSVTLTVTVQTLTQCQDTLDNDGDGKIDYPADPGCSSASDNDETDPSAPPSGGGGGGGGVVFFPQTNVIFSGRAYPKNTVTLLKDAQISATGIAGSDANFKITISGLSAGNYIFSLYSEDKEGRRSSLLTFPISITAGATTEVSGIFIAPTISVDKSEVKRGEDIAIFGQSAPQADIVISVNSEEEFFSKTISDKNGIYSYNFDTSVLDYGLHNAKSKASIGNQLVSNFSYFVNFRVGTKTILAKPAEKAPPKGDLNGDKRVNLIDFSVSAYWYKRANPPALVDLNSDGKVDLIDFSIMAFYWTG